MQIDPSIFLHAMVAIDVSIMVSYLQMVRFQLVALGEISFSRRNKLITHTCISVRER